MNESAKRDISIKQSPSTAPLGGRVKARKRKMISLGCIVNLRPELRWDGRRVFGLFLGSFTVTHEVPHGLGLRELSRDVARQTLAIKRHKLYLGTPMELEFARFTLKFFPPELRKKFYPKYYPLWGGITNINMNSIWPATAGEEPLDYFRGVSTGPATPLVLSATTVRNRMNIGLSYRSTVFSREDVARLKDDFMDCLAQLKEQA